jgi:Tfp pilus assembly protein PilN
MIRINLLPVELRHGNTLSPRVLITSFAAALVASAAVGWFGLVYFGDLGAMEARKAEVTAIAAEKAKLAGYYDKLAANKSDYQSRVQTIQDIGKSRRVWSRLLDEMIDVVNNNGDVDRHLAWFDGLSIKPDAKKGTTVTMPGAVQGGEESRVANLHEDLESAPFASELAAKSDPGGRLKLTKERTPPEAFEFQLTMQFKPVTPEPEKKPAAKPAAKTAAKPADEKK